MYLHPEIHMLQIQVHRYKLPRLAPPIHEPCLFKSPTQFFRELIFPNHQHFQTLAGIVPHPCSYEWVSPTFQHPEYSSCIGPADVVLKHQEQKAVAYKIHWVSLPVITPTLSLSGCPWHCKLFDNMFHQLFNLRETQLPLQEFWIKFEPLQLPVTQAVSVFFFFSL